MEADSGVESHNAFDSAHIFSKINSQKNKIGMALLPELSLEEVRMLTLALNELEVSILFFADTGFE